MMRGRNKISKWYKNVEITGVVSRIYEGILRNYDMSVSTVVSKN